MCGSGEDRDATMTTPREVAARAAEGKGGGDEEKKERVDERWRTWR